MAKPFFLRFLVVGQPDLIFEVREPVWDRLRLTMVSMPVEKARPGFFWFDTIDGRSAIINLAFVQAVRLLWEVAAAPPDLLRSDECIRIQFRGGVEVVEEYSENPEDIFALFLDLEAGMIRCPSFIDQDGEMMFVVSDQVVCITAPSHLLAEGQRIGESEG